MTFLRGGRQSDSTSVTGDCDGVEHEHVCVLRWTTPDISTWTRVGKDPQPFNLYMFQGNNPISKIHQVKEYVTGKGAEPLCFYMFSVHVCIICCFKVTQLVE